MNENFIYFILWLSAFVALPSGLIAALANRDGLDPDAKKIHTFLWVVFIFWAIMFFTTAILVKYYYD